MDAPATKLLVAIGLGTVLAVTGYMYMSSKRSTSTSPSKKKRSKSTKGGKKNTSDAVDYETVLQIFQTISQQMMAIMQSMAMYEQQIRTKAAGQVTEEELRDHINQTFVAELTKIERTVFTKFKCAESQVQAAVKKYGDRDELKHVIDSLKKMFDLVRKGTDGATKPSEMKLPENITRDVVFKMLQKVMSSVVGSIDVVGRQMSPGGEKLAPSQIREFNDLFIRETEARAKAISAEFGIDPQVTIFLFVY